MAKKPPNLIYAVDDSPPIHSLILLGFQHVSIFFMSLVLPVIIVKQLGSNIDMNAASGFISLTMVSIGVITILQSLKKGPIGSGYLCPSVCGPSYMAASMMAVNAGGLPVLFGMTGFVGIVEMIFSRVMRKLRFLFPSEVTGVIVVMVGIVVIPITVKNLLGYNEGDTVIQAENVIVSIISVAVMVGLNIYTKGKLKLYSVLIGMIVGYILSYFIGIIPASDFARIQEAKLFAIPYMKHISWKFNFALMIPFVVAALSSSFKTVGDLATCQRINDLEWKRPEMKSVSKGILADGIGGLLPGLIGGYGTSTSSANVGLSIATGATSRKIAFSAGGIIIALALFPKLAGVFLIMPKPVMGATLLFSVSFMIVAGLKIIISRMLDGRKTFLIGASFIIGLSADMVPGIYENIHFWLQPIFSSSLSLATVTAIVLNLILRIGITKYKTINLEVGKDSSEKIFNFMQTQGGAWGARKEVINKATSAMSEFMQTASLIKLKKEEISMYVKFDEFNLDINITYFGDPFPISSLRPLKEDYKTDEEASIKLSSFIIKQYVDKISFSQKEDHTILHLHLEH